MNSVTETAEWIVLQVIAQWELLADNSRLEQKDWGSD